MELCFILISQLKHVELVVHSFYLFCSGLTNSNYKELNVLYDKYREKGLFFDYRVLMHNHTWNYITIYLFWPKRIYLIFLSFLSLLHVGLEILAFPCNQFGGQEPGSNEDIQETVCTRFKAEFPIFDKVSNLTFQVTGMSCKLETSCNQVDWNSQGCEQCRKI